MFLCKFILRFVTWKGKKIKTLKNQKIKIDENIFKTDTWSVENKKKVEQTLKEHKCK